MATDLTIAAQTSADYGAHAWKDLQHWNRIGYLIILLGLGGFMLWATTAPLGSAVVSQGLVKVDSSRKKIQHLEGGTVKEILV
ncbi:MAG: secretion protein HlyD, partial [Betaproteobacteria bacterium]|nr:secretion protein HlyD [Betaproteobacteria bacterium]